MRPTVIYRLAVLEVDGFSFFDGENEGRIMQETPIAFLSILDSYRIGIQTSANNHDSSKSSGSFIY